MKIHLKTSLKPIILSRNQAKSRMAIPSILEVSDSMFFKAENEILDFYPTFPFLLSELLQYLETMIFHNLNTAFHTLERKVNQNLVIYEQTGNRTLSHRRKVETY